VPQSRSGDLTFRRLEPGARPGQPRTRCGRVRTRSRPATSRTSGIYIRAAPARHRRSVYFSRCPSRRSRCERSWASPKNAARPTRHSVKDGCFPPRLRWGQLCATDADVQTRASARSFIVGTIRSGWCGVMPKGRRRRSMKAVRIPADLAPMQSKA